MDQPSSLPRPSGLPRPSHSTSASSRLPVLRSAGSQPQLRAPASTSSSTSSTQLRPKPSLSSITPANSLSRKTSRISLVPSSTAKNTKPPSAPASSTLTRKPSRNSLLPAPAALATRRPSGTPSTSADPPPFRRPFTRRPSQQTSKPPSRTPSTSKTEDALGTLDGFRSASRASSRAGSRAGFHESSSSPDFHPDAEPDSPPTRTTRSSLSDRTIESLSNLPSSPSAGGKGRRRSSFFNADNSMPPPLRTPSSRSSSTSRPTTSDGASHPLPKTPSKLTAPSPRLSMTAPGKRSTSGIAAPPAVTPTRRIASASRPASTIKKPALAPAHNLQPTPKLRPLNTKTVPARTPKPQPSPTGNYGQAISPPGMTATPAPNRAIPTKKSSEALRKVSTPTTALRNPPAKSRPAPKPEATASPAATPSKGNSSSALREQIAKAREAARRNKAAPVRVTTPPRDAIVPDPAELAEFDFGLDPFNQGSKGGQSVLRKRVDGARADGRLNIAGMDLAEIPEEVLNMYQYDPNDASVAWGEVVDLTVVVAADNALERLPEAMFPDVNYEDAADSDEPGPQFGAIESLDLHGNVLCELPMGLRRLTQLSKLNLSRNKLSMDVFEVLTEISTLRELKLAENDLQGDLVANLQGLSQLEVLDLSNNKLTSLPSEVRELTHLRSLNVAENQLRSLPMELFASTPLIQLTATKNRFEGSFFSIDVVPHLQELRLSNNALTSLSSSGSLQLPALTYLDLSTNRLASLPDMSSWTDLATLLVCENKLAAFPEGFLSLQKLRIADFTANDLTKLDERIALMEALENLSLAANPIRERKFLTMSTDDIRRDLASRLPDEVTDAGFDGEVVDDQPSGPYSDWTVTPAGTLDLSNKDLDDIDEDALLALAETKDIRQLNLQQNRFTTIPPVLSQLTHLTTLDLSKNNITTLAHPISLPRLRDLRLTSNKLTTLTPLTTYLDAPALQSLDISQNRLTGTLPPLRTTFPSLLLLLASDNSLTAVPASSLTGLRTANIANNAIDRLDPRIGLLSGTLTSLVAEGNTFRVPGWNVLQKGTEGVLAWLRERVPVDEVESVEGVEDGVQSRKGRVGSLGMSVGRESWGSAKSSVGTAGEFFDADEGRF